MVRLSIIIPTYCRVGTLRRCLDCIALQTVKDLEAIVVSDGPDEKTAEMFQGLEWPFEIQYFSIPKSQQGVCRNRAVEKARGKYALLIGDDIFLAPDACEAHMRAHEKLQGDVKCNIRNSNVAVLGYTTWDPSLNVTKLMRWMEKSGAQFGYSKIEKYAQAFLPQDRQHWFTYTSNISLPTVILRDNQFREDVSLYGWEDIEWGLRLSKANIRLYYEADAKACHFHAYEDEEIWRRSRLLGVSAANMETLVPELKLRPHGWKRLAYAAQAILPTNMGRHRREFLKGVMFNGRE